MSEPVWLSRGIVDTLHDLLIVEYGGPGGTRDGGLVDSALARPRNKAAYGHADLPALAAAYAYGLAQNHGYIDGNKRVAATAMGVFLDVNGLELVAPEPELVAVILALAAGELGEEELAEWVRAHGERPTAGRLGRLGGSDPGAKPVPRRRGAEP